MRSEKKKTAWPLAKKQVFSEKKSRYLQLMRQSIGHFAI